MISFLSTPPVLREDDEVVTILVGVQDSDSGFYNDTVLLLGIVDESEGIYCAITIGVGSRGGGGGGGGRVLPPHLYPLFAQ